MQWIFYSFLQEKQHQLLKKKQKTFSVDLFVGQEKSSLSPLFLVHTKTEHRYQLPGQHCLCLHGWRRSWGLLEMCWTGQISVTLTSLPLLSSIFKSKNMYVFINKASLPPFPALQVWLRLWPGHCLRSASFYRLWSVLCTCIGDTHYGVERGRGLLHSCCPLSWRNKVLSSLTCTKIAKIILSLKNLLE